MLRTFPPRTGVNRNFLHNRFGSTMMPPFIDPLHTKTLRLHGIPDPTIFLSAPIRKLGPTSKKFLVETVRKAHPAAE